MTVPNWAAEKDAAQTPMSDQINRFIAQLREGGWRVGTDHPDPALGSCRYGGEDFNRALLERLDYATPEADPAAEIEKLTRERDGIAAELAEYRDHAHPYQRNRAESAEANLRDALEALTDIAVYGCGMLNQPAAMNGPEEAWLRRRIAEYERRARDTLRRITDAGAAWSDGPAQGEMMEDAPLSDDDRARIDVAWGIHRAAGPVATVVNNNQPGTQHIVETAPGVTLDIGTPLYHRAAPAPLASHDTPSDDAQPGLGVIEAAPLVQTGPDVRSRLLSLCDSSNWDIEMKGDEFRGYEAAMEAVQELVLECWDELGTTPVPAGMRLVPVEPSRAQIERLAAHWGYTLEETADVYAAILDIVAEAAAPPAHDAGEWQEPPLTCPHIDRAIASGELSDEVKAELAKIREINSQLRYGTWALRERPAPDAGAWPKVKPLEWRHFDSGNGYVNTPIGSYAVYTNGDWCRRNAPMQATGGVGGGTLDSAKAAAQADYERRILSALDLPTPPASDNGGA